MWLIPIGIIALLGFKGYQLYQETKPVLSPIGEYKIGQMSDGDAVILQYHWNNLTDKYRFLDIPGALLILVLPVIFLIWFFFTDLYEVMCYNLMGFLIIQPPLKKPIDGIMHDFGYRGMDHKLKTDSYKMNSHIYQFKGTNNCMGCGGNAWSGNNLCSFCGGER